MQPAIRALLFSQWEKFEVIFSFTTADFQFDVQGRGQPNYKLAGPEPSNQGNRLCILLQNPVEPSPACLRAKADGSASDFQRDFD